MVRAIATYGPMLDRYNGVSGLVGSQGRSQSALRTRDSRHTCASLTLTGRSMTGLSSSEGSSSVTGHPRMRPTGSSFPSAEQDARSIRVRNFAPTAFVPRLKADPKINKAQHPILMPAPPQRGARPAECGPARCGCERNATFGRASATVYAWSGLLPAGATGMCVQAPELALRRPYG